MSMANAWEHKTVSELLRQARQERISNGRVIHPPQTAADLQLGYIFERTEVNSAPSEGQPEVDHLTAPARITLP